MCKLNLIKIFLLIYFTLLPCFSSADDYKHLTISLLGKQIGSLKLKETTTVGSKIIAVNGEIFSSPFRVFNGQFEHKTSIIGRDSSSTKIYYQSIVDAKFKKRKINYLVKNYDLTDVNVFPKEEQTRYSNPEQIDFEFIDPAFTIAKLLSTPCQNSFIIYDGRRIIDVISIKRASDLECEYIYEIRKGPGHLMHFNFKKFEISTFFDQKGNSAIKSMIVKTGPFKLIFNSAH